MLKNLRQWRMENFNSSWLWVLQTRVAAREMSPKDHGDDRANEIGFALTTERYNMIMERPNTDEMNAGNLDREAEEYFHSDYGNPDSDHKHEAGMQKFVYAQACRAYVERLIELLSKIPLSIAQDCMRYAGYCLAKGLLTSPTGNREKVLVAFIDGIKKGVNHRYTGHNGVAGGSLPWRHIPALMFVDTDNMYDYISSVVRVIKTCINNDGLKYEDLSDLKHEMLEINSLLTARYMGKLEETNE